MKVNLLKGAAALVVAALFLAIGAGCKKGNTPNPVDPLKPIPVPDSALFVGTGIADSAVVYVLNATNGNMVNTYRYKRYDQADSYTPLVGNGFLYVVENAKIKALNINTGAILWTDSLKNAARIHNILHDDTFYGITSSGTAGQTVYALNATKQSDSFLWQYPLSSNYANTVTNISYQNGLIYINTYNELTVLDAKTGTVKWSLIAPNSVASLKEGIIISGNNLLDAATGAVTGTIPAALLVSNNTQTAALNYATKTLFFTRVTQFGNFTSSSKIYAYDAGTNNLKWSIDAGATATGIYSAKNIDQVINNQPIVKADIGNSGGIYGFSYSTAYTALDLNTGAEKWNFNAGWRGQNFRVDNTLYSCGSYTLNLAAGQPAASTISAADLVTGKLKWTKNDLRLAVGGPVAACVSVRGKGYAMDIQ